MNTLNTNKHSLPNGKDGGKDDGMCSAAATPKKNQNSLEYRRQRKQ